MVYIGSSGYQQAAAGGQAMLNSTLGIPKSPSFHSGLDLVATTNNMMENNSNNNNNNNNNNNGQQQDEQLIYGGLPLQLPSLLGKVYSVTFDCSYTFFCVTRSSFECHVCFFFVFFKCINCGIVSKYGKSY